MVKAGGRHRERAAAPLVHPADRIIGRALEHACCLHLGRGQALERYVEQHAEGAERSRHQPCDVESRHVLHHPAAERQVVAPAIEDAHAEDEVAHRAAVGPARPGEAGGDAPAKGRRRGVTRIETRRLERQHLSGRARCLLDVVERRPGACGHHKLGRIVVDDAGVAARVEHVARDRLAVEILGAAAPDPQRCFRRRRRADPRAPLGDDRSAHWVASPRIVGRAGNAGSWFRLCVICAPRSMPPRASPPSLRGQLRAVDDARLVRLDDGRFGKRSGLPFAQQRFGEQIAQVRRRHAVRRDAVGAKAKRDRRVECIGERQRPAKVRPSYAEAPAPFVPDRGDPIDVRGQSRRPRPHVDPLPDAHRHLVAQCRKPGMHFAGDRARPCPRHGIRRPHAGMPLGQVFRDRERIPDHDVAVMQAGHARRR